MTRTTNARVAGVAFLLYIATGSASLMRKFPPTIDVVLSLAMILCAFVLGVTLYRITCEEDRDLAMLAMMCRIGEGMVGALSMPIDLALGARTTAAAAGPDADMTRVLAAIVASANGFQTLLAATFFAMGSTLFCWLLLRGRIIPVALGWLGVLSSVLLVLVLPLQLAGSFRSAAAQIIWLPMAVFEVVLALLWLTKGLPPIPRTSTRP